MSKPMRIGIAGLGSIGTGVLSLVRCHEQQLSSRASRPIEVAAVSARDKNRDRGTDLSGLIWYEDARQLASDKSIDVVVELIGGQGDIAKEVVEAAIEAGKHVVTANKALIAHHGNHLARAAESKGLVLAYEAAVAGGIPIIKVLREGLAANRIDRLYGILNGTCNFILSNMSVSGRDFDEILKEAQELGYAEADPSFDIDGVDSAHKLAILAAVAFGSEVDFDNVYVEGIRHVSPIDIAFASELGYGIKLLGVAARLREEQGGGVEQRVHPCMVPKDAPINHVSGVYNAIEVAGDFVDTTIYEGKGAGSGPTASAVVADLIDIARGVRVPTFAISAAALNPANTRPMEFHNGAYYVRLMVVDRPGVFADIAAILSDNEVSMESVLQRGRAPGAKVPVVMTVHDTKEEAMRRTVAAIADLEAVVEPPILIRIEDL